MSNHKLMDKYNPKEFEENLYNEWEKKGYFKPSMDKRKESFCIVMPPPNVTGKLHMGHALDGTMQDMLIRYKRMCGYNTLWVPGTDHAAIATEVKVVEKMKKEEGLTKADITREQFLFYEVRTTAKLLHEGCSSEEVVERIISDNLFQYPTEKSVRKMALACLRRLEALGDNSLVAAIATQPSDVAKQICLYAMMKQYRLIWDFMITVIGEKYRLSDTTFGKIDLNSYFLRLQEQDDWVATWSDSTVTKLKQGIVKILEENEYIDNIKSVKLNPVWLQPVLENAIRENGDEIALPAFNCFS